MDPSLVMQPLSGRSRSWSALIRELAKGDWWTLQSRAGSRRKLTRYRPPSGDVLAGPAENLRDLRPRELRRE